MNCLFSFEAMAQEAVDYTLGGVFVWDREREQLGRVDREELAGERSHQVARVRVAVELEGDLYEGAHGGRHIIQDIDPQQKLLLFFINDLHKKS
jgi:hypothetical protein